MRYLPVPAAFTASSYGFSAHSLFLLYIRAFLRISLSPASLMAASFSLLNRQILSHSKIFSTRPALHKFVRTFSSILLSICNVNIQGKGKEKNSHALQEQQVSDFFSYHYIHS